MTHSTAAALDKARAGDTRALARLISLVEDESPQVRSVIKDLLPDTGRARIVGLTGAPGVGKSTVTGALLRAFRAEGRRVAVLAVDPSSPFTGGALLGDRIRMQEHATDQEVFIRSMASRGHLGGLAASTPQAIRVLDAVGFELILIETVGVGQAEVAIASLADSVLVLLAPGMGDAIQAAKAGILEVADLFVVNKADKPDAHQVVRDLRNMIAMVQHEHGAWKPPIVATMGGQSRGDRGAGEPPGRALVLAQLHRRAEDQAPGAGARGARRAGPGRAAPPAGREPPGRAGQPGRGGHPGPLHGRRRAAFVTGQLSSAYGYTRG